MKVVIPVAGVGSRLRPHTHTQPKSLVPVADKTILGHIIDKLLEAGLQEFVFVIGYLGEKVEHYVRSTYPQLHAEFVVQEPREGLGHALWVARHTYEQDESVLIMLGDAIVDVDLKAFIEAPYSVLGIKKVAKPSLFGVTEVGNDEFIVKLVEKPKIPKSNFALVGLYKIVQPKKLVASLEHIIKEDIRTQEEYHLTDALMHMIKNGEKMVTWSVDHWFDCGRKETLLEANATLLNRPKFRAHPPSDQFPGCIIIPPVSIGSDCAIYNSIIGPNVAIGDNATIENCILSNSIIGTYAELRFAVMQDSIIGSDASFRGFSHSLNIGDSTEINFGQ
ncbi:glucose-1-phosphate thymidylyltransferase [Pontibacter ummariensis]|uniref:Glucose-1-phosphate thymidylyltransferase n=1 Tax=Pontibacter ummariensis TaxID=1610492 RepID=A0A239CTG8_9BACT|nr:sugar phosphate nucleotidyltransferase [Pontibacter ummariensis]PRY14852.1 glucose-1-phosphate thymidylyltransferase [Pontibacter ummariensis]SNS23068.1 glucose-1-phosphate thymidylyltransferase [Pontibacter ummariensis]